MVQISFENNIAVLKFPRQLASSVHVQEFLEWLRIESILEKSEMTDEQAWELSEKIKEDWWQKNKDIFLQR